MAACGAFLLLFLLEIVVGGDVDVDILSPTRRCIPTATQVGNCHVCMCKTDGVFYCLRTQCDIYKTPSPGPIGPADVNLPEIREGEPCIPNKLYKMECNKCRCTKDYSLMCTKMGCINWKNLMQKGTKKALRNDESNEKSYLPKVQNGVPCKPGKVYRSMCKRCYCNAENKIKCSKKLRDACTLDKHGNPPPIQKPEDIHPTVKLSDTVGVPALHSASEQCVPGKMYKVDCNLCVCMETNNLLCQKKLCLSYEDMNRIDAKEMSGKPCTSGEQMLSHNCKTCECVGNKTVCHAAPDCTDKPKIMQLVGKEEPPEELDPDNEKFKCLPHTIYKNDCNKCYCQEDGSLRCTQKICLNYSQVKQLDEQREYLEKHGL